MKYKIGDRVYYKGRKWRVFDTWGQFGINFIKLSGSMRIVSEEDVKPIVRCGNE